MPLGSVHSWSASNLCSLIFIYTLSNFSEMVLWLLSKLKDEQVHLINSDGYGLNILQIFISYSRFINETRVILYLHKFLHKCMRSGHYGNLHHSKICCLPSDFVFCFSTVGLELLEKISLVFIEFYFIQISAEPVVYPALVCQYLKRNYVKYKSLLAWAVL